MRILCNMWWRYAFLGSMLTITLGCGDQNQDTVSVSSENDSLDMSAAPELLEVPDPAELQVGDTEEVLVQLREQYTELTNTLSDSNASDSSRGRAYGEMGKWYMAAGLIDTAISSYLNAHNLMPTERRWSYYLGHLYRYQGEFATAGEFFESARKQEPNDLPTLVWLGEMYLAQERPNEARLLLEHAVAVDQDSLAAWLSLGRIAVARADFFRAAEYFETALMLNPEVSRLYDALAQVYFSLGERDRADALIQQAFAVRTVPTLIESEVLLADDPLMESVDRLLESVSAYQQRGLRALNRSDPEAAASFFRRGLVLAPDNLSLRLALGRAEALVGDVASSQATFNAALQLAPENAEAHYNLGVLMEGMGQLQQALARYTSAVRYDANYIDARLRLGRLLRMAGRQDDAIAHFERVKKIDPNENEAYFGHAMVLVSLERYAEAVRYLEQGSLDFPEAWTFTLALSRLLSAAPQGEVRDGHRAVEVMEALPDDVRLIDFGETMAMALAESGNFEDAIVLQQQAIESAAQAGVIELVEAMSDNLKLYEANMPSRIPWRAGQLP